METQLIKELNSVLKSFPQFWEGETLLRAQVVDAINNKEPKLIKSLIENPKIKQIYGTDIDGIIVFDFEKLASLLRFKEYWADSFTKYRNKIGLTSNGKYLDYNSDVVLDFPFKDCVLEGGMTKEEQGKNEVYYNEIIARDEIDRLFSPKVFTNTKRYSKDGVEDNITAFHDDDNLIIKGNNLIALHSLKQRFAGKVKLIYIDPPYNTGNDSFKYNDRFNRSTWLTFMKNRLEVARELLSDDGVIFVQCDDSEQAYLKVLMDNIIGGVNYRNMLLTRRLDKNLNTQFIDKGLKTFNIGADYILIYSKSYLFNFNPVYREATGERAKLGYWKGFHNGADRPTMRYEILGVNIPDGQWKWKKSTAYEAVENYNYYLKNCSNQMTLEAYWEKTGKEKKFIRKNPNGAASGKNLGIEHWIAPSEGILRTSNWTDILTTEISRIVDFSSPKSEKLIYQVISSATQENDIVLDFHLGSGTTAAVAHKMGRRYIGIEQMDYIDDITVPRLQKVIDGEQGGISKDVAWQGGGSFVYTELKQLNAAFIEAIDAANSYNELVTLFDTMKQQAHLNYQVELDEILTKQYELDGIDYRLSFKDLKIDQQKQLLKELLDKNQLYINASEMDDASLDISLSDKAFTKSFYGEV